MDAVLDRILTLNLVATTAVFYVAARIYLLPRLDRLSPRLVMIPILLLHSLRHLGLMFLTRGATYPGLPREFAWPAALGDLVAALLAFVSIFLVLRDWTKARPLVWVFNMWRTNPVRHGPSVCRDLDRELDDPSWFKQQMDVWTSDAHAWDQMNPALPKFEKYPK